MSKTSIQRETLSDQIATDLNNVAVKVILLSQRVDPGHIPMIKYLRAFEKRVDRLKNDFRARVAIEDGSHG